MSSAGNIAAIKKYIDDRSAYGAGGHVAGRFGSAPLHLISQKDSQALRAADVLADVLAAESANIGPAQRMQKLYDRLINLLFFTI